MSTAYTTTTDLIFAIATTVFLVGHGLPAAGIALVGFALLGLRSARSGRAAPARRTAVAA